MAHAIANPMRNGCESMAEVEVENYLPNSPTARTNGSADAREKPHERNRADLVDEGRWLIGYRHDRVNRTVHLLGFKPPVTDLLKTKRWAVKIPNEGWTIPASYLGHVERLLAGADVDLFDVSGDPTPNQRLRDRGEDHGRTRAFLDELRSVPPLSPASIAAIRAEHGVGRAIDDAPEATT